MPIAFHKDKTVKVWLDVDAEIPEAERPTFVLRFSTALDAERIEDAYRRSVDTCVIREKTEALREAIRPQLIRGENFPPEHAADPLAVLTIDELRELATKCVTATRLAEDDLKKSRSPRPSDTGSSAPAAAAAPGASA